MISDAVELIPLSAISVDWDSRRPIDESHAKDLAFSIAQEGLIHTIIVDESTTLAVGGHRLSAFQFNQEKKVTCPVPEWKDWSFIPARRATNITPSDLARIELVENLKHRKLSWKEEVKAITELDSLCKEELSDWSTEKTATLLNIQQSTVSRARMIQPLIEDPAVTAAPTFGAAWNIVQRQNQRKAAAVIERAIGAGTVAMSIDQVLGKEPLIEPSPEKVEEIEEERKEDSPIINDSFLTFAPSYSGPRFNFLHCDFPYGINLTKSGGQNCAKDLSTYDDSEDVYWTLLQCLVDNQDKLLSSSCHIMFWFSQNLRRETEDFFAKNFPTFSLQKFLMIWDRIDNAGLLPDAQRYGRRNYETAFLLTSGDRKIVRPKALAFPYGGNKSDEKLHRSQKPIPVLTHFFSMFIDETTTFLDPTCGSGTSLRVAHDLSASHLVGLEIDSEMAEIAQKAYARHLAK